MIQLAELCPEVTVQESEYLRLLGYPRDHELEGRARELAQGARAWYARHGKPWIYAREAGSLELDGASIHIDGAGFSSPRLGETLRAAAAHSAVLVAVSAGPELERESQKLWSEEKPDEYFFLEMFGSAVVEQLTMLAGARLCAWAEGERMAVLPHYSPGYAEWNIAEQPRLLRVMQGEMPGPIESLDSGALRPRKSLLAVFGVTRRTAGVRLLSDLVACQGCSLDNCQYRRAPYRAPLPPHKVNVKALKRWAQERLVLKSLPDGTVEAAFRYEGTTCTNMGRPLAFDYRVLLGTCEEGYPIREQHCAPASGDTGHMAMCRYLDQRDRLMAAIEQEKPLAGRPLHDVLSWTRPSCAAGCYCDADAREHKWGLVLETIQYALAHREGRE
uniref:Uncharacterized protein n=1 Tax=Solibacter usitatus (strain Ellin6076) TaxID=234267 RepID=Q024B5_SOLUE